MISKLDLTLQTNYWTDNMVARLLEIYLGFCILEWINVKLITGSTCLAKCKYKNPWYSVDAWIISWPTINMHGAMKNNMNLLLHLDRKFYHWTFTSSHYNTFWQTQWLDNYYLCLLSNIYLHIIATVIPFNI